VNFNKLTLKAQESITEAQNLARGAGNPELTPEHLLVALLRQDGGIVSPILNKLGLNPGAIETEAASAIGRFSRVGGASAEPMTSPLLRKVFDLAFSVADEFKDEYVSTEHLLIGLTEGKESGAAQILRRHGVTREAVLKALQSVRGTQRVTDQNPEDKYQALERYSRDLTALARRGKLDPVIGRDEEIRRVIQVLSRRTKNNPVLIGEPGVGKTAIIEGLARRIVEGDVPEGLKNKRVVSLDLGAMIAGAKYRGEFEDRLKAVIKEVEAPERRRERWMLPTSSSPLWPAASCARSGPRPSMSIRSTSKRMPLWSAASSLCTSESRASKTPSPSSAASRSATRFITA